MVVFFNPLKHEGVKAGEDTLFPAFLLVKMLENNGLFSTFLGMSE